MIAIDFSKTYRIEPIPSKENEDLSKLGVSSFPGTTRVYGVKYNSTLRKYTDTGLDINSPEIAKLTGEDKKKQIEAIASLKADLETSIGVPNFLDTNSDNWCSEICRVEIETGQDLKVRVNGKNSNTLEPAISYRDKISLLILYNSKEFPTSKLDIDKPEFRTAKFYLTTDGELDTLTRDTQMSKRRAQRFLSELFDTDSPSFDKAWNIAFYLDLTRKLKPSVSELDKILMSSIENDKRNESTRLLVKAFETPMVELEAANNIKKASMIQVIKYHPDGYYYRGNMNFRKTLEETTKYLLLPENAAEYAEITAATEKKIKGRSSI